MLNDASFRLTRVVDLMLLYCWASVKYDGPPLQQRVIPHRYRVIVSPHSYFGIFNPKSILQNLHQSQYFTFCNQIYLLILHFYQ